jgi:hypothetical protein
MILHTLERRRFMSRVNKVVSLVSGITFLVLYCFNIIGCESTENVQVKSGPIKKMFLSPSEEVRVDVRTDEYIMPVAELKTTKTYPEILEIENKYIIISIVPHRGRILFDYIFKSTGNNEFYRNARPIPKLKDNDYVVEFGGYYLSLPWNPRDRQPYDLEYEVLDEGPDIVQVYMWGEDFDSKAIGEIWVTVERDSSLVQVKIKISNKRQDVLDIDFNDYTIIAAGGELTDNCSFVVPTSEVTIGQSTGNWMGMEGEKASWPQRWSNWSDFEHFGLFNVLTDNMYGPFGAVINHDTGDTLIKMWEPFDFFNGIDIWSLGKDYKRATGGEPTVNYENYKDSLSIPSNGSVDYISYFYVLKDMQNVVTADTFFAGWIQSEKQCCEIRRDSTFVVKSQLGSSKEYENMNLVVSLTDLEGNIVNRIISEPISVVSPSQICTRSWTVNLHGLGIESNGYRFKLDILDSNGRLLFTTSSLPVAIKY